MVITLKSKLDPSLAKVSGWELVPTVHFTNLYAKAGGIKAFEHFMAP